MTKDVLEMIVDTYRDVMGERIIEANELYEAIWERVLNYYSNDLSSENIIEIEVLEFIDEDKKEVNNLLFNMLRKDGFQEGENYVFSLPASVITCLANQQEDARLLRLKNHL